MKFRFLLPLLFSLVPRPLPAEEPVTGDLDLTGDQGVYEQKNGSGHVLGNVHLVQPGGLDLRCEDFVFQQTTNTLGRRGVDRVIATTNVLLVFTLAATTNQLTQLVKPGSLAHATAFQAIFNGTNNTVTLTGSTVTGLPKVVTDDATFSGAVLVFDRATGRFTGDGGFHMTFKADLLKGLNPKTNAPAGKL